MSYRPEDDAPLTKGSNKRLEKLRLKNIFEAVAEGEYGSFPLTLDFAGVVYSGKKPEDIGTDSLRKIQEIRQIFDEKGDAKYHALYKSMVYSSLDDAEQDVQRGLHLDALTGVFAAERYFMHSREWANPKVSGVGQIRAVPGSLAGYA
jgi:hypothetical protein